MADVKLESTETYRVVSAGLSYLEPAVGRDENGEEVAVMVHRIGHYGEEINLTKGQVARLVELGAIKSADEPLGYKEQTVEDLEQLAADRGIEVAGTGANGGVLKGDLVSALETYDAGQTASGA